MKNYIRVTKWETNKGVRCVKYWQYSQEQIAERLALLEDMIENGELVKVPFLINNSLIKRDRFGNLCEYIYQYRSQAEAKLKELEK